eukprot:15044048-Alexandrium_andersonii.AAC.1
MQRFSFEWTSPEFCEFTVAVFAVRSVPPPLCVVDHRPRAESMFDFEGEGGADDSVDASSVGGSPASSVGTAFSKCLCCPLERKKKQKFCAKHEQAKRGYINRELEM